jgi:hypothetical protein
MKKRVFISYARRDWDLAEGLAENLSRLGHDVWIDAEIQPNEPFRNAIGRELHSADAVIVIWTRQSVDSPWVRWEAKRAITAGKLVQVRTPDVAPADVGQPFSDYDMVADISIEDLGRKIAALRPVEPSRAEASIGPQDQPPRPRAAPPAPARPTVRPALSTALLATPALSLGLLSSKWLPDSLAAAIAAISLLALLISSFYVASISLNSFMDRFGRQTIIESIFVGLAAALFAGVLGGFHFAVYGEPFSQVGIAYRFQMVLIFSAVVGCCLSYLIAALARYVRLVTRARPPAWAKKRIGVEMLLPVALSVTLMVGAVWIADSLPRIGTWIAQLTGGRIDWIGSGICTSVTQCIDAPGKSCANCSGGSIAEWNIALIVAIFLAIVILYHLQRGSLTPVRIALAEAGFVVVAAGLIGIIYLLGGIERLFGLPREEIVNSWRVAVLVAPWLALITTALFIILRFGGRIDPDRLFTHT